MLPGGRFQNRTDAGRVLATHLKHYAGSSDLLVLALPRGGVPIAYEVASALNAPLDVFLVRKLGVPGHEEFAMGAIASGGIHFLNRQVVADLQIPRDQLAQVIAREELELQRREGAYGGGRAVIRGRTV